MDEIDGCIMLQSEAPVLCLCSPWGFGELKAQAEFQMWLQEVANVYLPEEFYQCRHVNCKRKIRVSRHEYPSEYTHGLPYRDMALFVLWLKPVP